MKHCNTCNTTKELHFFARKGKGYQSMCKECRKIWFKNHYKNNKQYYIERNSKSRKKNIEWFKQFKSTLFCNRCGESDPACLDFHHTNPSEKDGVVSKFYTNKNKLIKELEKCEVLCANCHRKHHYYN